MKQFLSRLEIRLAALDGWFRVLLCLICGAGTALAFPSTHMLPLALIFLPLWILLLDSARNKWRAFWQGWWFGLGYFALGLYWIGNSFAVRSADLAWMAPFAVAGLSAGLALFMALTALAYRSIRPLPRLHSARDQNSADGREQEDEDEDRATGWGRALIAPLLLASLWCLLEWLRMWILTGFPWNMVGYIWSGIGGMEQSVSLFGTLGLSFYTLFLTASMALAARGKTQGGSRKALLLAGLAGILLLLYGGNRLSSTSVEENPDVRLRIVQPAIDQRLKWRSDLRDSHFRTYLSLTRSPGFEHITHVIWPETALPFYLNRDPARLGSIGRVAVPPGGRVLTGAPRASGTALDGSDREAWNSLFVIDGEGQIESVYDKAHLVPFGEYMPLKEWIPLAKMTHGGGAFSPGPGPVSLKAGSAPPMSVLICYEIIFPGEVMPEGTDKERPEWMLNITNDAWFGDSAGPYQHFHITRFRAIEEGVPVVRAANTGISAIIDPLGRVPAFLALGQKGTIDHQLPRALPDRTLFATTGHLPVLLFCLMSVLLAFACRSGIIQTEGIRSGKKGTRA